MTTLTQVVDAIATRLKTIPGLRVYDHVPADPNLPAACILPPVIDYRDSAETDTLYEFEIVLLTSGADHKRGQHAAWPFLERSGTQSVFAAIEANRSLGLTGIDAHVRSTRPLGLEEIAAAQHFGVSLLLVVSVASV